jgi:hypothetical protein
MSEASVDASAAQPARKGWGPFTGRQLTTIICVIAALVLFPFGAWAAVAGSNAFITDPSTGNRASVSNGQLTTNVAPTHNFISSTDVGAPSNGNAVAVITASSTHADLITQVDLDWDTMTPGTDYAFFGLGKVDPLNPGNGPCGLISEKAQESFDFSVANDTRAFNFNPAFAIPGGMSLCIAEVTTNGFFEARAYGYFTTSTAVASPFLGRWLSRGAAAISARAKR